ncbi:MAG: hypothetical protein ACE5LG_07345, partial [Anaerolineae bacterium]
MKSKWSKRIGNNRLGLRVGPLIMIGALLLGCLLALCLFPHLPIRLARARATPTPSPTQPTATLEALEFLTPTKEGETITPTSQPGTPTPTSPPPP